MAWGKTDNVLEELTAGPLLVPERDLMLQLLIQQRYTCSVGILRPSSERHALVLWKEEARPSYRRLPLSAAGEELARGIRERSKAEPRSIALRSENTQVLGTLIRGPDGWSWGTRREGLRIPGGCCPTLDLAIQRCLERIDAAHPPA